MMLMLFFFSSRRRHTRLVSDWSSDVCSSDLTGPDAADTFTQAFAGTGTSGPTTNPKLNEFSAFVQDEWRVTSNRSEERRVGKECRFRMSPVDEKEYVKDCET